MSDDDPRKDLEGAFDDSGDALHQNSEDEPDDTASIDKPLTPEDFREALQRIDALGLAWTADRIPRVTTKESHSNEVLFSEEYEEVQTRYPNLPREVGAVVLYALTGNQPPRFLVGDPEGLPEKTAVVRDLVITANFRSQFFFLHAIKVPYFSYVDWEVVIKAFEKNVDDAPRISYALLSLYFRDSDDGLSAGPGSRTMTVAVDTNLVDRVIDSLKEVKSALERARVLTDTINWGHVQEDNKDD